MRLHPMLAAPLVLGLLLTGCSKAGETGESNTTQLPARDVNAQPRDNLQRGGELRMAVDELGSLNPMSADSKTELDDFRRAVLPTFFSYDEHGIAQPNTAFLESANETSPDPTQVELVLNKQATWGDGSPITAKDVIATWQACNGRSAEFRCASDLRFNQLQSVTQGADDHRVQLRFNRAQPDWREVFSRVSVLRADSVKDANTFNTGWDSMRREWSSGPFWVTSISKPDGTQNGSASPSPTPSASPSATPSPDPDGANPQGTKGRSVTATPNTSWWAEKPLLERLSVREIPQENQIQAYTAREIDVVDLGTSPELFKAARTVPEGAVRRAGATTWRQLVLNTASPRAVSDPAVRKAIAQTLDRSAIGTRANPNIDFSAAALGSRVLLPAQDGYRDNAAAAEVTRDLAAARKTLDGAGWKESNGARSKDGQPLELNLVRIQGVAASEAEASAIAEQLGAVGIKVNLRDASLTDFDNGSLLSGGNFDLVTMGAEGSPEPVSGLSDSFASGADKNYSRLQDPEVDRLLDQLATEPSQPRRIELANQLDTALWTSLPTIPLYQQPETVGVSVRVANLGARGLASTSWEQVGFGK